MENKTNATFAIWNSNGIIMLLMAHNHGFLRNPDRYQQKKSTG